MINDAGMKIIKECEGCALQAYQDQGGKWTIGYGSTHDVYSGLRITQEDAEDRLVGDLRSVELMVNGLVHVPLNSNQLSALLSLVYNIGVGRFAASSLLINLNNLNYTQAAKDILLWDKVTINGVKSESPGLARRRQSEMELFLDPNCSELPDDN